jgi:hypothetical protein
MMQRPRRPIYSLQSRRSPLKRRALIVLVLATLIFTWVRSRHSEPVAATPPPETEVILAAESTPAPLPTELDENFLTQVNNCLIATAAAYGYDLYINSGFRSFAEQDDLYASGRTRNGRIYTNAKGGGSVHNYGLAADVADHKYGQSIDWQRLIKMGTYCGLENGDRGHEDLPHFQHVGNLSNEQLFAGKRPPLLTLPCAAMKEDAPLTKDILRACGAPDFGSGSVYKSAKILEEYE